VARVTRQRQPASSPTAVSTQMVRRQLAEKNKKGMFFTALSQQREKENAVKIILAHMKWPDIHGVAHLTLKNTPKCPQI